MAEDNRGGERYNREGLANWAAQRFATSIPAEQFEGRSRADLARTLIDLSSQYFARGRCIEGLDDRLDKACQGPIANGHPAPAGKSAVDAVTNPVAAKE